jgi:phosphatidylserine decarboxylase
MDFRLKLLETRVGGILTSAVGWAAARRWPQPLLRQAIRLYSKYYGVRLEDAAAGADGYTTFLEFFTRHLRPGLRPIDADPSTLVSPVDGRISACGPLVPDALLQAKGFKYRMEDLVASRAWADRWAGGVYLTFYLNPADYHRFHAPLDLEVLEAVHVPGRLLPVNEWSRQQVPDLYVGNERIVVRAAIPRGEALLVFVAATSVGRVRLVFDELTTHDGSRHRESRVYSAGPKFRRGEELGRFELGSTVILLVQPGLCTIDEHDLGQPVLLGQRIGRLNQVEANPPAPENKTAASRGSEMAEDVGIEPTTP